ncbi:MAG: beta-eliminating lyase-related protein [Pseudomonadota bacterium]
MTALARRGWVPADSEDLVQRLAADAAGAAPADIAARIEALAVRSRALHEAESFNLNPAANVMNPRAEALLASGLGQRPSLGWPGAKYETGLQAIEEIEVLTAELAAQVFRARHAEIRAPSGAVANLMAFMALATPGDAILAPPAAIGGHVTHHAPGAAGLYGLVVHDAPVNAADYSVDPDGLRAAARRIRPRIITLGGSLNLWPHPVAEARAIADEVGAALMFDAAHLSGPIAGGAWPDPLAEGAHVMTMSAYKSLGGPPSGLIVTNEAEIAQRLDAIAFPGLTANYDAAKAAALGVTLTDWLAQGPAYAAEMRRVARAFAAALHAQGVAVHGDPARGFTGSHAFALEAGPHGGGEALARRLEAAGLLASAIGLPDGQGGTREGLRLGVNEAVRWGLDVQGAEALAALLARAATEDPATVRPDVQALRRRCRTLRFVDAA